MYHIYIRIHMYMHMYVHMYIHTHVTVVRCENSPLPLLESLEGNEKELSSLI